MWYLPLMLLMLHLMLLKLMFMNESFQIAHYWVLAVS